jgi:hypothetical protein
VKPAAAGRRTGERKSKPLDVAQLRHAIRYIAGHLAFTLFNSLMNEKPICNHVFAPDVNLQ